jgi:hypothetical protein
MFPDLRIRVRIDPPHPLVCRKRRLRGNNCNHGTNGEQMEELKKRYKEVIDNNAKTGNEKSTWIDWLIIYGFTSRSRRETKNLHGLIDWLIIYGFTSRSRIFHLYWDVTIAGEGLQNLGLCSALRALEQGGIFIVPHLLWHGTSVFSGLIRRTAPLLLRFFFLFSSTMHHGL